MLDIITTVKTVVNSNNTHRFEFEYYGGLTQRSMAAKVPTEYNKNGK
jgi:hypothetical protein